jgi:rare lipoprotein A
LALLLAAVLVAGCAGPPRFRGGRPEGAWTGKASYYHDTLHGNLTASGEVYDKNALTAAHRSLAFGTVLRVRNLENGKSVRVKVNDRGPFVRGRVIDLSRRAAETLDFIREGVVEVAFEVD